jgi:hypothetical protein
MISRLPVFPGIRNSAQSRVAALGGELLKPASAGIHDSFQEIGGHSLTAVKMLLFNTAKEREHP